MRKINTLIKEQLNQCGAFATVFSAVLLTVSYSYGQDSFNIQGENVYPGCNDPVAVNYDPSASSDDGSCEYPVSSCGPDVYTYCYDNNEFVRFYYEAASGTDLYVLLNSGQVQGGADYFFIWDNFEGIGTPLYTVSGELHAGTILHSGTGELMIQIVSGPSVSCATHGLDPVSYTVRCEPPAANGDCVNAEELDLTEYPSTDNAFGNLWFVENSESPVCAGNTGADLFYTFTLAQKNSVIVNVNPFAGADVVVQVLDACEGSEIACSNLQDAGDTESILLEALDAGSYTIRVHNESGDVETESSGLFMINVQQLPFVGVQDDPANFLYACNQTGFTLDDFVGATPQLSPWILDYQWLIGEVGGGFVNEWQRGDANYSTRLSWLGMEYGSTYNVFVRMLIDHPEFGEIWTVYSGDYTNPNTPGASSCTIATASNITPTELRPNYSPTNAQGNDYEMCDIAIAYNIQGSENFRWRFDPDMDENNGNEIYYTRGAGNPSVMLKWVNGLVPGLIYSVAVEVQVNGQWSGFSTEKPLSVSLPPNDVIIRPQYCNTTMASNSVIMAESVCKADYYSFEFENTVTGAIHTANTISYPLLLSYLSPQLTPGDYNVRVRVNQNGVPSDFGPACPITIGGSGMAEEGTVAMRDIEAAGNATLFPNPNAGSEVRVSLDGLSNGNHNVNIMLYDMYGKRISNDAFGHKGSEINRLIRFDGELSTGVYMVHILVDGEQFAVERMIIK